MEYFALVFSWPLLVFALLGDFGVQGVALGNGTSAAGNCSRWFRLDQKVFAHFKKHTVVVASRTSGHIDRFSAINIAIENLRVSPFSNSAVLIFEPIKGRAMEGCLSVEVHCPQHNISFRGRPLSSFHNGGGGELPALRLIRQISSKNQCGRTGGSSQSTTVHGFVLKRLVGMTPGSYEAFDNLLGSSCHVGVSGLQSLETRKPWSSTLPLQRTGDVCKRLPVTKSQAEKEMLQAAAIGVHERSIMDVNNGFYLSEWIGQRPKPSHEDAGPRRRRLLEERIGGGTVDEHEKTANGDLEKHDYHHGQAKHYNENMTLKEVIEQYRDSVLPTADPFAYPLLHKEQQHPNGLDGDGQGDELTPEEASGVFLPNGPVWSALSIGDKEKVMQASRARSATLTFVETKAKTQAYISAGVHEKNVIKDVANKIVKTMPFHIVQLLVSLFRGQFAVSVGQFLQSTFGGDLMPASDSTPDVAVPTGHGFVPTPVKGGSRRFINHSPMRAKGKGYAGNVFQSGLVIQKMSAHLEDQIRKGIEADVQQTMVSGFSSSIAERIKQIEHGIHNQLHRSVAPDMSKFGTEQIVQRSLTSLVRGVSSENIRHLTASLIPALTHSLAPTITHALKHSPRCDYYCYFCHSAKVYCKMCHSCKVSDWEQDYYAVYYAGYYSSYYTSWYANTMALHFTQEALDRNDDDPDIPVVDPT